ncbi:hypothetical protein N9W89_12090 [Hellea sp.]|nr:hypothetical protein [Hellea sp.]
MLTLESLPAYEGDAFWIEWGETAPFHKMLIDMGRATPGKNIRKRIENLPEDEKIFELLIVTHVDEDHIGGVVKGLVRDNRPGPTFKDIWFNGREHLSAGEVVFPVGFRPQGVVSGERLTTWLLQTGVWNNEFGGGPVTRPDDAIADPIILDGGMKIWVLGPTQAHLENFIHEWDTEIQRAERKSGFMSEQEAIRKIANGFLPMGGSRKPKKPKFSEIEELYALADIETDLDGSPANKSSISVLLEYEGTRLLMTGDQHAPDLLEALNLLSPDEPVSVDVFKVPHHCSTSNVTADLIEKIKTPKYLISTGGNRFYHPDSAAIARIIKHSPSDDIQLCFNVPSVFNRWWANEEWQEDFGYSAKYGAKDDGLLLKFET